MSALHKHKLRDLTNLFRILIKHDLISIAVEASTISNGSSYILKFLKLFTRQKKTNTARQFKEALIESGPVYIKLGQLLSTRGDIFSTEVISELSQLQDTIPPSADFDIESFIAEQHFSEEQTIRDISLSPIASASIAQIYTGRLTDDTKIILKVVRPEVEEEIRRNMQLLKYIAEKIDRWLPSWKRFRLPKLMNDQELILLQELDMHSESRNQIQLRRNFADSDLLYVPRVYTEYTRTNLLVMEWVDGISIGRTNDLRSKKVDIEKLAKKGVETFFTQVFTHNFFHADMHPGNIFIDVSDPNNPKYVAIDCAIVGSLSELDKNYLAKNVYLFFNRDYLGIAELQIDSGWVSATTNPKKFAQQIENLCEPIFEQPLSEIFFAKFLAELFQVARDFEMEVQPQLALLQKTLFYVEGLGRELYPDLNLWSTAKPFMNKWISDQYGVSARLNTLISQGPKTLEEIVELPELAKKSQADIRVLKRALAIQTKNLQVLERAEPSHDWRSKLSRLIGVSLILLVFNNYTETFSRATLLEEAPYLFNVIIGIAGLFLLLKK